MVLDTMSRCTNIVVACTGNGVIGQMVAYLDHNYTPNPYFLLPGISSNFEITAIFPVTGYRLCRSSFEQRRRTSTTLSAYLNLKRVSTLQVGLRRKADIVVETQ